MSSFKTGDTLTSFGMRQKARARYYVSSSRRQACLLSKPEIHSASPRYDKQRYVSSSIASMSSFKTGDTLTSFGMTNKGMSHRAQRVCLLLKPEIHSGYRLRYDKQRYVTSSIASMSSFKTGNTLGFASV